MIYFLLVFTYFKFVYSTRLNVVCCLCVLALPFALKFIYKHNKINMNMGLSSRFYSR